MKNAKVFFEALDELEKEKGISKQSIIDALKEALAKAYIKQLGGGEDGMVRVDVDETKPDITMCQLKKVVEDVQDDYIEISLEEAKKVNKNIKVDDMFEIPCSPDELTKLAAMNVKSILRQKLSEAEKTALFASYKDKIGEMITGTVEKSDDRATIVNIGRTSVYLSRKEMIGDEHFEVGQQIKLYVADVSTNTKGPQIQVTRSDAGFLKRLFEEEIHEIYDGTVVIKSIAREAGIRSKVSVYSANPDVDPSGSCIGQNGARIQKIVSQLGNGKDKEKIDIIAWNENPGLYIVEALRPSTVVGVSLDEATHKALAVVKNEQLSLAIGKKGANARLAVKLTGWNIDIKEEKDAIANNIAFKNIEKLQSDAQEAIKNEQMKRYIDSIKPTVKDEIVVPAAATIVPEATKAPANVAVEQTPVETSAVEEVKPQKEIEKAIPQEVKETPVVEAKEEHAPAVVKTTKSLGELEKELEAEKARAATISRTSPFNNKNGKRPRKITDEEAGVVPQEDTSDLVPTADKKDYMSIYSEEELKEMEEEASKTNQDQESKDDDVDYDEFDKYYDSDEK